MSVQAKNLIQAHFAPNAANTEYTAPSGGNTIIDKFTVTNIDSGTHTVSVYLVAALGTPSTSNLIIDGLSITGGSTADISALQNQILNSDDFIAVVASAGSVLVIRASGREVT